MDAPLSLNDRNSIKESHRLIDDAISRHECPIVALKAEENSFVPISRLPPEILSHIFAMVKRHVRPYGYGATKSAASLQWIEVTHVSSYWRRIAIDSPILWVDPPLGNLPWVKEMFQRSKEAGLVIRADLRRRPTRIITQGLKLALKHSSRIQELSILGIYDAPAWNNLQQALPKVAPRLEYCCISGDYPITILDEVLCETKSLRRLVLSNCNPNWNSHPSFLRSLKELTLHELTLSSKLTVDALKGMPDLEFLDIRNAFLAEQQVTRTSDQIHLASLRTLRIYSIYLEVETFLRHVTFPPTARVQVSCVVNEASTSYIDPSGVISGLSRSYSNAMFDMAFHTLVYVPFSFSLQGDRIMLSSDCLAKGLHIADYQFIGTGLELAFQWPVSQLYDQCVTKLMSNIFSGALPLREDVTIHLNLMSGDIDALSAKALANTFGTLPQVCSVMVSRDNSRILFKALELRMRLEDEESGTGSMRNFYFPRLSSIYFNGTKFWKLGVSEFFQDPTSISVELLKDCLLQRSESGAKVENLTLRCCRKLGKHDVRSLSQVVGDINWDERESYSDSDSECDWLPEESEALYV